MKYFFYTPRQTPPDYTPTHDNIRCDTRSHAPRENALFDVLRRSVAEPCALRTQSVEEGIPTRSVGTRRSARRVLFSEVFHFFFLVFLCLTLIHAATRCSAGDFDRIEGELLATIAKSTGVERLRVLSLKELDRLPSALKDTRATFLIIKTGAGNYTRMLVSQALRKAESDDAPAVPVLVLERFDTFEPGKSGSRLARGAGLLLFDGFQLDLDSGQVVPKAQGGDVAFASEGPMGPRLEALGKAEIITLKEPVKIDTNKSGPSPGKTVIPTDFAGRYQLHADGRWSGLLELEVAADRQITGRFRSEANGTTYPVTGQVGIDPPHKATFFVKFPRTEQEYEAFLSTEGKQSLAGTFVMNDRRFGFYASREGLEK